MKRSVDHPLNGKLANCLSLLQTASDYAADSGLCKWQFALEFDELVQTGATISEIRWLVAKGLITHAQEITLPGEEDRKFRDIRGLTILPNTCFIITEDGMATADESCPSEHSLPATIRDRSIPDSESNQASTPPPEPSSNGQSSPLRPVWDPARKELRVGKHLVKIFKWPAINQELILTVFEEEGWPPRIDDPLPVSPDQVPKRRLHDTIKCLNRSQKSSLIRFRGDGTGEGVLWELVED